MKGALRLLLLTFVVVFALFGCGGGGGGGGNGGGKTGNRSFTYSTDWSNRSRAVTGASQDVSLYNNSGTLVKSVTLNATGGVQTSPFTGLPDGTYKVIVTLYAGVDRTLGVTGIAQVNINLPGTSTVQTEVGTEITSVELDPQVATIQLGATRKFTATAYTASGKIGFVAPGGITYTIPEGVGTVSETGTVTITSLGEGTLVATVTENGVEGQATLNSATPTVSSTWTVLVYMAETSDRAGNAITAMNAIEEVAGNPGLVRFVVQWKKPTGNTSRYVAKLDTSAGVGSTPVQDMGPNIDMGHPNTLTQFIQWGKFNYPADHYVLVVWGDGNGWNRRWPDGVNRGKGIGYDDLRTNVIQAWELQDALDGENFDVIAFDASYMGMAEIAYELRGNTQYFVATPTAQPVAGFPYDRIFQELIDNPDMDASEIAVAFSDGTAMYQTVAAGEVSVLSVFDTTRMGNVLTRADEFSLALFFGLAPEPADNPNQSRTEILAAVNLASLTYQDTANLTYKDMGDFARIVNNKLVAVLNADSQIVDPAGRMPGNERDEIEAVITQCGLLAGAISQAIPYGYAQSSHYVAIGNMSVDFTPWATFLLVGSGNDYAKMDWGAATSWKAWFERN